MKFIKVVRKDEKYLDLPEPAKKKLKRRFRRDRMPDS